MGSSACGEWVEDGVSCALQTISSFNQIASILILFTYYRDDVLYKIFFERKLFSFVYLSLISHCFKKSEPPINSPKGRYLSVVMGEGFQDQLFLGLKQNRESLSSPTATCYVPKFIYMCIYCSSLVNRLKYIFNIYF